MELKQRQGLGIPLQVFDYEQSGETVFAGDRFLGWGTSIGMGVKEGNVEATLSFG